MIVDHERWWELNKDKWENINEIFHYDTDIVDLIKTITEAAWLASKKISDEENNKRGWIIESTPPDKSNPFFELCQERKRRNNDSN